MKRLSLILLALVLCLGMLAGCSSKEPEDNTGNTTAAEVDKTTAEDENTTQEAEEEKPALLGSEEDFKKKLPNYSCEIHYNTNDQEAKVIAYKVHPDGVVFKADESEDSVMIFDIKNNKLYVLNETEKSGFVMSSDFEGENSFVNPATYFMPWQDIDSSLLKKSKSVTVDGRKATVYIYEFMSVQALYTIDDEYGVCLSYEMRSEGDETASSKWEMKNLQIGKVTEADISVPADYNVTEFDIPS